MTLSVENCKFYKKLFFFVCVTYLHSQSAYRAHSRWGSYDHFSVNIYIKYSIKHKLRHPSPTSCLVSFSILLIVVREADDFIKEIMVV